MPPSYLYTDNVPIAARSGLRIGARCMGSSIPSQAQSAAHDELSSFESIGGLRATVCTKGDALNVKLSPAALLGFDKMGDHQLLRQDVFCTNRTWDSLLAELGTSRLAARLWTIGEEEVLPIVDFDAECPADSSDVPFVDRYAQQAFPTATHILAVNKKAFPVNLGDSLAAKALQRLRHLECIIDGEHVQGLDGNTVWGYIRVKGDAWGNLFVAAKQSPGTEDFRPF